MEEGPEETSLEAQGDLLRDAAQRQEREDVDLNQGAARDRDNAPTLRSPWEPENLASPPWPGGPPTRVRGPSRLKTTISWGMSASSPWMMAEEIRVKHRELPLSGKPRAGTHHFAHQTGFIPHLRPQIEHLHEQHHHHHHHLPRLPQTSCPVSEEKPCFPKPLTRGITSPSYTCVSFPFPKYSSKNLPCLETTWVFCDHRVRTECVPARKSIFKQKGRAGC